MLGHHKVKINLKERKKERKKERRRKKKHRKKERQKEKTNQNQKRNTHLIFSINLVDVSGSYGNKLMKRKG